ncbi:MAG TPA: hypothetical protein VFQ35_04320 [Polyangiaceae bacterium]|nr:hypothetical protein [Polyangiaceae bacterium]
MGKKTKMTHHRWWVLATSVLLAGCGEDTDRYETLDRLRVLAIRSEAPDLAVGETAKLSARVYEPTEGPLRYEWSWCPSRGDADVAFACNIPEQELARAWVAAELDGEPPTYALGTEREAELTHMLTPELVTALCQAPDLDERIQTACFEGFEASVQLTVSSTEAQVTAIKSVPLLMDEEAERNRNPTSDFTLSVSDKDGSGAISEGEPLRAGHQYVVTANIDEGVAESFMPAAREGEPPPRERRETLVMSWFITVGELDDPDGDDGELNDDFVRTTFVDGRNTVEDLARNGWKVPLTAGPSAELHVVLRDERGGVGWATRRFEVVGGEP